MSKHFRPWKIDETHLLPPSVQDYVAEDHLSGLIVSVVRESLDLSEIAGGYTSGLGQPPFDPQRMTALLLHSYASGLYSSRRIARATVERSDFMMIVAGDPPDFRTILRLPQAASEGAGCFICAGIEACGKGRPGEARARGARRHKDQGERLEAQGDEL
jgi:transposase